MGNYYNFKISYDSSNFVEIEYLIKGIIIDMRYNSNYNFVGEKIDGYLDNCALLTLDCANALKKVNEEFLKDGYCIKVFDAYRPYRALLHFEKWLKNDDESMKEFFYKDLSKLELMENNYVSLLSSHTRGSTIDMTIVDLKTNKELDMGSSFDEFGIKSNYNYKFLTQEQLKNRYYLREKMKKYNFKPLDSEWWHFTLIDEPYNNTYFNFPVKKGI